MTDPYAALRVPDFRRFIGFLAAQTLATMMQGVAVGWQLYAVTHDPLSLGLVQEKLREFGVSVIEDACEAVGGSIDGRLIGSSADSTVFAFYPNKQMTSGEGGMVVTNDDSRAALFRSLRNQGRDEDGLEFTQSWVRYHDRYEA